MSGLALGWIHYVTYWFCDFIWLCIKSYNTHLLWFYVFYMIITCIIDYMAPHVMWCFEVRITSTSPISIYRGGYQATFDIEYV